MTETPTKPEPIFEEITLQDLLKAYPPKSSCPHCFGRGTTWKTITPPGAKISRAPYPCLCVTAKAQKTGRRLRLKDWPPKEN